MVVLPLLHQAPAAVLSERLQVVRCETHIGNDVNVITLTKGGDKLEFLKMEKNLYYLKTRRILAETSALNAHLIPEDDEDDDSMPGLVDRCEGSIRWEDEDDFPPPLVDGADDSSDEGVSSDEGGA